jgi:hypothetical protein
MHRLVYPVTVDTMTGVFADNLKLLLPVTVVLTLYTLLLEVPVLVAVAAGAVVPHLYYVKCCHIDD